MTDIFRQKTAKALPIKALMEQVSGRKVTVLDQKKGQFQTVDLGAFRLVEHRKVK